MPAPPVIDVEGVTVVYGDFTAVDDRDVSFHVQQGELYALLNTNGAGKTSTLEVIEPSRRRPSRHRAGQRDARRDL